MYKHKVLWTCLITFLFGLGFAQVLYLTRTSPSTIPYILEGILIGIVMGLLYAQAGVHNGR